MRPIWPAEFGIPVVSGSAWKGGGGKGSGGKVGSGGKGGGGKGGGGRPDMAQAGGPDGSKAKQALEAIEAAIAG